MAFAQRYMTPAGVAQIDGWRIKQYLVAVTNTPLAAEVVEAARSYLPKLLPIATTTDTTPRVAFSVLHRGVDAIWLNLYAWVYGEILHCRAASAPLTTTPNFTPLTEPLIGCVWELPALVHERSAWVRHGLQPESPAVEAYLADVLPSGPVGAP